MQLKMVANAEKMSAMRMVGSTYWSRLPDSTNSLCRFERMWSFVTVLMVFFLCVCVVCVDAKNEDMRAFGPKAGGLVLGGKALF